MSEEIEFTIHPDGTIEVDMIGYKGKACEADMKKIALQGQIAENDAMLKARHMEMDDKFQTARHEQRKLPANRRPATSA